MADPYRPGSPAPIPTTTTRPQRHAVPVRGMERVPSSSTTTGRFGRMFRHLPVFEHSQASLEDLATRMVQLQEEDKPLGVPDEDENPTIPAGYTYLGQFIDHDITFDPNSSLQKQNDPDALENFRTPRFDLDSVYGRGPSDQPYLYNHSVAPIPHPDDPTINLAGTQFLLGNLVDPPGTPFAGPDLPRNKPQNDPTARALTGDPRNDENLIVSQLHLTMLKFHNLVVEHVATTTSLRDDNLFKEAQRQVRWHYQWVVINDFLKRIAGADVVADILQPAEFQAGGSPQSIVRPKLLFYHWKHRPFIPVEFAVAAYRFGHSMVRPSYFFNDFVRSQTEPNRTPIFSLDTNPLANLNGFRPLPGKWGFQWKYFFETSAEANLPQPSYRIDSELVFPLGSLPPAIAANPSSLALRNLLRGLRMGLPSGQSVALAMGITPLTDEELEITEEAGLQPATVTDLEGHAPLWYYILKEAEVVNEGTHLGPVGGRIVAEVFIGLLAGDPCSYLSVQPTWTPELPPGGTAFSAVDLIKFATGE